MQAPLTTAARVIRAEPGHGGVERLEARFLGCAFAPHRHDTYAGV